MLEKEQNLLRFINEGEGQKVEFKETFKYDIKKGNKNKQLPKEVSRAACGFLNSQGGIIFIGISDACDIKGIENDLRTYNIEDIAKSKDIYFQEIKRTLKEHLGVNAINNVDIFFETIKNSEIIVVQVKASDKPVFYFEKFIVRNGPASIELKGKEMYDYLVNHFNLSQGRIQESIRIVDKMKIFREDRVKVIKSKDWPLKLSYNSRVVLLMIAEQSFGDELQIDLNKIASDQYSLDPIDCTYGRYHIFNPEGLICMCGTTEDEIVSYTQIYRNGIIESVNGDLIIPSHHSSTKQKFLILNITRIEKELIRAIRKFLETYKILEIPMPIYIFLTFTTVKDYFIKIDDFRPHDFGKTSKIIDRDDLFVPYVKVESYNINIEDFMRSCFDFVWNACGEPRSLNYDDNGKYLHNTNY